MASAATDEASSGLRLLSGWFCPYAQRARIALNHKGIDYELVEATDVTPEGEFKKIPLLLEKNPNGQVPVIVDSKGEALYESHLCVEFAEDFKASGPPLFPAGAMRRGQCRLKMDWVNARLCSPFYVVLMKLDEQDKLKAHAALCENLRDFSAQIVGPYFYGQQLTAVDIAAFPWVSRFYVFAEICGAQFAIDVESEEWKVLGDWMRAVFALEAVKATIPDRQRLVKALDRFRPKP